MARRTWEDKANDLDAELGRRQSLYNEGKGRTKLKPKTITSRAKRLEKLIEHFGNGTGNLSYDEIEYSIRFNFPL
jgi:hypothetical protein